MSAGGVGHPPPAFNLLFRGATAEARDTHRRATARRLSFIACVPQPNFVTWLQQ